MTSLSERIYFLGILGSLYDTFGIHSKAKKPEGVSFKQANENVAKVDNYVKDALTTSDHVSCRLDVFLSPVGNLSSFCR